MKRVKITISILLLFCMVLSGCTRASEKPMEQSVQAKSGKGGIKVYTSFYPMYFLASEIAGDKAEVLSMVPAGAEPHDWEPSPKMVIELSKADMLIYNGVEMEPWIDNILPNINTTRTIVVDASKGIELIEPSEHDEEEDEGEAHEHGSFDPHIWVSPVRAVQQAQTIYDAILKADPDNKAYYDSNFNKLTERLTKLDGDIKAAAKTFKSNVIVVSHDAFGYFAKDYGFQQIAIRGVNPQEEPSPAKMGELAVLCRAKNVRFIFFEKLTSPKLSETLASEIGAGTLVLNDAAGLNEEDIKSGKDYITVMYENLENLKKALGD